MGVGTVKGERAITVLADLIDWFSPIASDPEIQLAAQSKNAGALLKKAVREYPREILHIIASLEGVADGDFEAYARDFSMPRLLSVCVAALRNRDLLEILGLFGSADQRRAATSSGPASENTKA